MALKQDWLMRQIDLLIEFVARTVFRRDTLEYRVTDEQEPTETDRLYRKLQELLSEKKICEAEDLLFDSFENTNAYLLLTMDFYQRLNKFTDSTLRTNRFSRAEVSEGLRAMLEKFDIALP